MDIPALELGVADEGLELLVCEGEAALHKLAVRLRGHADLGGMEAVLQRTRIASATTGSQLGNKPYPGGAITAVLFCFVGKVPSL
jgi:hypothetical protein